MFFQKIFYKECSSGLIVDLIMEVSIGMTVLMWDKSARKEQEEYIEFKWLIRNAKAPCSARRFYGSLKPNAPMRTGISNMKITARSGTKILTNFHLLGSFLFMAIMLNMRPRMMQVMLVKKKMIGKNFEFAARA